jgi:2-polyprenyl-3-methyl-5-hydroxy-6-metoxy-1,4-benzoquinol methylase
MIMTLTDLRKPELASEWKSKCSDRLASRWPDFVDYAARLCLEGPFLQHLVNTYGKRVLDCAMGIGCESIFLAASDAEVVGNEINSQFRSVARRYARKHNVGLRVTAVDWRNLSKVFPRDSFDVVLVLGNSLCLLQGACDRRKSIANFAQVCNRGGVVVVDQRNFNYILRCRKEILNGNFRYGRRVMYCGTKIDGYPIAIDSDCVRFAYQDTPTRAVLGYLDMYPFKQGELGDLFHQEGFSCQEVYSNLRLGYDSHADFYTYVFRKY